MDLPEPWLTWLLQAILLLMALEALGLLATRGARRPRLGALAAGAGLVLAWRLSLAGAPDGVVAGCLGLAGLAHAWAWWRWRPARAGRQAAARDRGRAQPGA